MKNIIFKIYNRIPRNLFYTKDYRDIKKMLNDNSLDLDRIRRTALKKQLINALINVPYYRELKLDINPDNISEENVFDVIKKFPYLTKKIIMDQPEKFVSDKINVNSRLTFKRTSGGSTGNGIKVYRNLKELMIERAFYDYEWEKYGYKPYSKVVRMGCDGIKKPSEDPFTVKGDKMFISPYHLNKKWIGDIYRKIKEFEVEFFHAYPSNIEYLAKYMKDNSLKLYKVKGIFLASERVSPMLLDLLNEVFDNVPISFSYGLTERSNLAWGLYKNGEISYRIEELYGYSENYLTKDGRYEIVGTSFWNTSMPFIRYRTQDFGKIENNFIESLDGRNQEFLITKDNNFIPGFTISIDKFVWNYVEAFQVIQNKKGEVEFHIVPKDEYNKGIRDRILERQLEKWGDFFDINIIEEKEIVKTSSGKTRLIINNLSF